MAGIARFHLTTIALAALATLALAASGSAQPYNISVNSQVGPEQIKKWLESSSSRLVAWGAYFASKSNDAVNDPVYLTIMERRVARWAPPSLGIGYLQDSDDPIRITRSAVSEILNTIIEKNEAIPALSLAPVLPEFPAEALILATRLPAEESTSLLEEWYERARELKTFQDLPYSNHYLRFGTIAAMLLAQAPPPGFAAGILSESGEELSFWVTDETPRNPRMNEAEPAGCATRADRQPDFVPGPEEVISKWPPLFQYVLESDASLNSQDLLIDAPGNRIGYRRLSRFTTPGGCLLPQGLSFDTRHRILAELLGIDAGGMPWPVRRNVFQNLGKIDEFIPALTGQIDAEESKFRATVRALQEKGYLTQTEADTVRPQLSVIVKDIRTGIKPIQSHVIAGSRYEQPSPLPRFVSSDSRTTVTYDMHPSTYTWQPGP